MYPCRYDITMTLCTPTFRLIGCNLQLLFTLRFIPSALYRRLLGPDKALWLTRLQHTAIYSTWYNPSSSRRLLDDIINKTGFDLFLKHSTEVYWTCLPESEMAHSTTQARACSAILNQLVDKRTPGCMDDQGWF